jgi:hypothetical protein
MKTNLDIQITTAEEAKSFLTDLFTNGEHYHPEDDAFDVQFAGMETQPSKEERGALNALMDQAYGKDGFDPCDYMYDLIYGKPVIINDFPPCQNFAKND